MEVRLEILTHYDAEKLSIPGAVFLQSDLAFINRPVVHMTGTIIERNTAEKSGGGIFVDNASILIVDGINVSQTLKTSGCHVLEHSKPFRLHRVRHNAVVGEDGYGEDIGTTSAGFCVKLFFENGTHVHIDEGDQYHLSEWKSGDPFPTIHIKTFDSFGGSPSITKLQDFVFASFPSDAKNGREVKAILTSTANEAYPVRFIPNDLLGDLRSGISNISLGSQFPVPNSYQLIVNVEGFEDREVMIVVGVRECHINEVPESVGNGVQCRTCESNQYSFYPDVKHNTCKTCPDNANCSSKFIVPRSGYWNAFLCSEHVEQCLNEEACYHPDASTNESVADMPPTCNFTDEAIADYQASQCADGYEGVICGSCTDTAGRLGIASCNQCLGKATAGLVITATVLFQLILAFFQIKGASNCDVLDTVSARRSWLPTKHPGPSMLDLERCESLSPQATIPAVLASKIQSPERSDQISVFEVIKARLKFQELLKARVTSFSS